MSLARNASALILATLLCAAGAHAQQSVVEECRRTTTSAEDRIACLEAALLAVEEPAGNVPVAPLPVPAAPEATAGAEPMPAAVVVAGTAAPQVAPQVAPQDAPQSAPEPADTSVEPTVGLRVAAYEQVAYRRLQVTLENGQVWRQINGDTQVIRVDLDRNQTVDITDSVLGGFKLRLNELQRTIRVQRVR